MMDCNFDFASQDQELTYLFDQDLTFPALPSPTYSAAGSAPTKESDVDLYPDMNFEWNQQASLVHENGFTPHHEQPGRLKSDPLFIQQHQGFWDSNASPWTPTTVTGLTTPLQRTPLPLATLTTTQDYGFDTIFPPNIQLHEDRMVFGDAQDALIARFDARYRSDLPPMKDDSPFAQRQMSSTTSAATSPLKRPRAIAPEETQPIKEEIVESISSFSRSSRNLAPLPRRKSTPPSSTSPYSSPPYRSYEASPVPSSGSSISGDYDWNESDKDGAEFVPSKERVPKRQKSTAGQMMKLKGGRKGKKTQLQIVLEDLPFTLDDIVFTNGLFHCPFPQCCQTTTSEGDLGRHLESSAHATHGYVCLATQCLTVFAREDSMKRHHANNRGKHHLVEHERCKRAGYPFRVKNEDIPALKADILAARGSPSRQ